MRCQLRAHPVEDLAGHPFSVLEVDCPRHERPVGLGHCMGCPALVHRDHHALWCDPDYLGAVATDEPRPSSSADRVMERAAPVLRLARGVTVRAAWDAMASSGQHEAVVVDEDNGLVGVVSAADITRLRTDGEFPDGEHTAAPWETLLVETLARPLLIWINGNAGMREAVSVLNSTRQSRVVVVQEHKVVGAISRTVVNKWLDGMTPCMSLSAARHAR